MGKSTRNIKVNTGKKLKYFEIKNNFQHGRENTVDYVT